MYNKTRINNVLTAQQLKPLVSATLLQVSGSKPVTLESSSRLQPVQVVVNVGGSPGLAWSGGRGKS